MRNTRVFDPIFDAPLYPGEPPLRRPEDLKFKERVLPDKAFCRRITEVSTPTYTFYPATGTEPHPLVVVCPGGGYSILAYNHEGVDVAAWLVQNGVSVLLLKYRCPDRRDQALADARRAVRLARSKAEEWNLDPEKIGILGFSAGAHLSVRVCASIEPDAPAVDEIDKFDSHPDFAFVIYPAYLYREGFALDEQIDPKKAPPTFLIQSQDDPYWESSFAYAIALRHAGVPFEMHIYPDGGHGWGVPRRGRSHDGWTETAMEWFRRSIMKGRAWQFQ